MTQPPTTASRAFVSRLVTTLAAATVIPLESSGQASSHKSGQTPPTVGGKAKDFSLAALDGTTVRLSDQLKQGPVVLVVLRGWPGYQCPFCTRQFGEYLARAQKFEKLGARVLFVYPGPSDGLKQHAEAFSANQPLPAAFRILPDPGYQFTNAYGLRWDAPKETAYPSTFVIDKKGVVRFAQVSQGHGDRVPAEIALKAVAEMGR